MKKILLLMSILLEISSTSFAMTFYQPVQVGYVEDHGNVGGGYKFKGTVSNTGTLYEWQKDKYYKNGVAAFGKDNDLIYLHYNDKNYFDEKSVRKCVHNNNL